MVYRVPHAAPESQLPPERRGRVVGHYCLVCASIYPLHRAVHAGRPVYGRDHVASPCAHEGDAFRPGEAWWEPAVEVLPAAAASGASAGGAGAPAGASPPAAAPPGAAPPPVAVPPPSAGTPPPAGQASPPAAKA
jgi:hypothetical protein